MKPNIYINDEERFLNALKKYSVWGFDIETWNPGNTPDPYHKFAVVLTVALAPNDMEAYTFVLDHPLDSYTTDEQFNNRINAVNVLMGDNSKLIVGHNLTNFDVLWWKVHFKKDISVKEFDTRIAHSHIDENSSNSLEDLSEKYTDFTKNEDNLNRKRLNQYDPERVAKYNAYDALISRTIFDPIVQDLIDENQIKLFETMSKISIDLRDATFIGTNVDTDWIDSSIKELREEADSLGKEIEILTGGVNVRSNKQLADYLFKVVGLPILTTSKAGAPSTSAIAFLTLKNKANLPKETLDFLDLILKYRELEKLIGTYLKPFKTKHLKSDGRLHTTFNVGKGSMGKVVSGTVTGRLSSSNPNLQNQPRDNRIRGVIVPSDNLKLFDADYSQLELCILCWFSSDKNMCDAFASGKDLHTVTMSMLSGISYEEGIRNLENDPNGIWKNQRVRAKRVNFGIPYGVGPYGLMLQIWDSGGIINESESRELLNDWRQKFSGANHRLEKWKDEAIRTGRIITPTGRIRRLPGASRETKEGQRILRQGINFPIQSFASDITLIALHLLNKFFNEVGGARVLLTVHDSIMGEYNPNDWEEKELERTIKKIMVEDTLDFLLNNFDINNIFDLPLSVDVDTNLERWKV